MWSQIPDRSLGLAAMAKAPAPCGPVPRECQLRWQGMEYCAFIHFSLNTYTDQSWGYGNEDVGLFNPEMLDCRQWARICAQAGMKGLILVAKHHCGFCLWPTDTTGYSVKNAPWKGGKGDVVRELADACREYGLRLGIYVSPWDRNSPAYGKPEYIEIFRNQIKEVLSNYGEIFEIWFDGANGGDGYYGGANETRKIDPTTYYDWKDTYALIRRLQPGIVIWNDGGDRGDLRWVGTEEGFVGETNWSLLYASGEVPWDMLHHGVEDGNAWVPAEVNTSIRPEWFYHPSEDAKVKTLPHLMNVFYSSIGRNANLLLNFPIMPNGLINGKDEKTALDFAEAIKESFAVNIAEKAHIESTNTRADAKRFSALNVIDGNKESYWASDDDVIRASLTIDLVKPTLFNRFLAQEYIALGQRVRAFTIEALVDGRWRELAKATTIGYKRIIRFPSVKAAKIRLNITDAKACPAISNIGVYNAPLILDAPIILRDKAGKINILSDDIGPHFFYTMDGSQPDTASLRFDFPFASAGKTVVKAIAQDPASGMTSPVTQEIFDICKEKWEIIAVADEGAKFVLDGDPATVWHQREKKMPVDLVIDLGGYYGLCGFKYLPDQNRWSTGLISNYEFFVSVDGREWILASRGEFPNIKNNPVWQIKTFEETRGRYVKLRALKNIAADNVVGYAGFDVITS